jgi:hypothetical protein
MGRTEGNKLKDRGCRWRAETLPEVMGLRSTRSFCHVIHKVLQWPLVMALVKLISELHEKAMRVFL